MVALTHYIEAVAAPYDGEDVAKGDIAFAMSSFMAFVHGAITDGAKLAVAFPSLVGDGASIGLGNVVRVFGSDRELAAALATTAAFRITGSGLIGFRTATGDVVPSKSPQALRSVPAHAEWEVFARSRRAERGGEGYLARTDRRLRRRISEGKSSMTEEALANRMAKLQGAVGGRHPAYVHVDSGSTGRRFRLFVDRYVAPARSDGSFDTYGLSKDGATVPSFA